MMCNMAIYAGPGRAAPELIKLLQAQEGLAGGHFTGIATLHEGKIHLAKVCGDCRRLLESTDAMELPGSIGIAHSRTPGIALDSWAQPFLASDGMNVYCANGIGPADVLPDKRAFLQEMADRLRREGMSFATGVAEKLPSYIRLDDNLTYHDSELAGAVIGYFNRSMPLAEAMTRFFAARPAQLTALAMSVREPDRVLAFRYNQSLFYGRKDGAYCAATSGTALQDLGFPWIAPVPPATVSSVRADRIEFVPMEAYSDKLTVAPDLGAVWKFLDGCFADGKEHCVIELCDELPRHPELDAPGMVAQDSFAVYSYLMEKLRRGELLRSSRMVPASRPGTMRSETVFRRA